MSGRPLALVVASSLAAVALTGCALLFVSTEGLSGGPDGPETSAEGGGSEGGTPGEGGMLTDGGPLVSLDGASNDSSIAFCAANPGHTFCDDFDDRTDIVSAGWSKSSGGRGVVRADVGLSRSAPRSLRSETAVGATVISYASLERDIGTTNRVRLSFDLYITSPGADVGDSFVTIRFPNGYLDCLWFTAGGFWISERTSNPTIDHKAVTPTPALPSGKWMRLQLESTPGRIFASVDGVTLIDATTTQTQIFQGAAGITLGLYSEDTYAIGFNYDNVLVDTTF
jgi:hypothetical protein